MNYLGFHSCILYLLLSSRNLTEKYSYVSVHTFVCCWNKVNLFYCNNLGFKPLVVWYNIWQLIFYSFSSTLFLTKCGTEQGSTIDVLWATDLYNVITFAILSFTLLPIKVLLLPLVFLSHWYKMLNICHHNAFRPRHNHSILVKHQL